MSKYLFHVLIGLDAAFPLHLSWLQLEAAEMTFHVHILDTHCSRALSNSNRQEGGKGNPVLPLPCTFYLTPNLLLNEPVTEVCRAVYTGCHAWSGWKLQPEHCCWLTGDLGTPEQKMHRVFQKQDRRDTCWRARLPVCHHPVLVVSGRVLQELLKAEIVG